MGKKSTMTVSCTAFGGLEKLSRKKLFFIPYKKPTQVN